MARRSSRCEHLSVFLHSCIQRPGYGHGGWPGWRSGRRRTERSDLQAGQFAKRASFTRSVKETRPAIPGHGKGPPRGSAGIAGLAVSREGWQPFRGETLGL